MRKALLKHVSDRIQGRVLEIRRADAFEPDMRGRGQSLAKLAHQARLADSRFTHDRHNLPLAIARPLPAIPQKPRFIVTSKKGRKTVYHRRSQTISRTAQPHDSIQLDRFGDSLNLMSAALLYHEQARNQPVNGRSDNHCIRIGRRLYSRSDVGSIAEDFRVATATLA